MVVKELTAGHMKMVSAHMKDNREVLENYSKMMVVAVIGKAPKRKIEALKKRKDRMENCNRFWLTDTYEASKVKHLRRTYLCHDRFCSNCSRIKQYVMKTRFLPLMEQYNDSLYHIVLTMPNCSGKELADTVSRTGRCFKTLVNYLNGNQKIKQMDFSQYGYQGCIRSLEIMYKGENTYHPHFHVAAVFDNPKVIENKHINNIFSKSGERLFSEFEVLLQRMWWLLINRQRLTSEAICGEGSEHDRCSCIVNRFRPDDPEKLFGYITKTFSWNREALHFNSFRALYNALDHVRQIQGYGIFYNVKAAENDLTYTEQEHAILEDYVFPDEEPVISHEPLTRLVNTSYTILRRQYRGHSDTI